MNFMTLDVSGYCSHCHLVRTLGKPGMTIGDTGGTVGSVGGTVGNIYETVGNGCETAGNMRLTDLSCVTSHVCI